MVHKIKELKSGDFFDNKGKGFFYSAAFEITFRCNFKCVHCYIEEDQRQEQLKQDLDFRQVCAIIDKLVDFGCLQLLFTGGEPLLRGDFLDIYAYAKKKGMIVDVFTNGTLFDDKIIAFFIRRPPRAIQVSLYGMNERTYCSLTQVSGAYQVTRAAIELLRKNGLNVRVAFPVLAVNKPDFLKAQSYVRSKGVHFAYNPVIFPSLDGGDRPFSFVMPPEEVVDFDFRDAKRYRMLENSFREFYSAGNLRGKAPCSAGDAKSMAMRSIVINSSGEWETKRYFPCLPRNYSLLGKESIKEILADFRQELAAQRKGNDCLCKSCRYLPVCGRCFNLKEASAVRDWYFCRIAREREARFKRPKR